MDLLEIHKLFSSDLANDRIIDEQFSNNIQLVKRMKL